MKKFIISLLVGSLALGASAADTDENPIATVSQLPGYCTIFHQWGFIGDSLCSGEHESLDEQGHKGYHDYYDYSWDSAFAAHAAPKARTSRKVAKPQKVGFSISGTPQTTAMPM